MELHNSDRSIILLGNLDAGSVIPVLLFQHSTTSKIIPKGALTNREITVNLPAILLNQIPNRRALGKDEIFFFPAKKVLCV